MLLIDNEAVKRVLSMRECIEAQELAFAGALTGASVSRPRLDMFVPCDREDSYYRWGSVEGASDGVLAVRLKSDVMIWPEAPDGTRSELKYCMRPGIYCGLVLRFSTADGEPLAIINGGQLQHVRVGASTSIGARLLARADAHAIGMIGSAGMAGTVLEALVEVRDIHAVNVYSRSAAHREAFAAEMSATLGMAITPVASAREAVRGADILATCTDSMHPAIEGDWLEAGMHVVNVGPLDLGSDATARIDVVVRQGIDTLPMPEDEVFRKGVGHSHRAFVGGSPQEQKRPAALLAKARRAGAGAALCGCDLGQGAGPHPSRPDQPIPAGEQLGPAILLGRRAGLPKGQGARPRPRAPDRWFLQDIKN
jgi:alanine dehydrogenase